MKPEFWRRVEELFQAALERAPEARQAFLDEVCGDEADLRRRVELLLAKDAQAESFLEPLPPRQDSSRATGLIGRQFGTYQIVSFLGAGGMGEVYRAHDTKLGRDVALKALPVAFMHDPDRLSRFQREARVLASLNHPNIATIHGLEHSDGAHFLVMELVSGHTLAERVSNGPLGIEETLAICSQIAEALEAAHEKGVVHRDLKPANVKVTPEGRAKVLDFGLAKAFAPDGEMDFSKAPTGMSTEEGKILGTPAYMSPEQACGKPLDRRVDIWAFGCVLYELLTGKAAFRAETVNEILARVLEHEPDWQALPAATPAKLRELLHRCLEKDSNRRLRDIGEARIELFDLMAGRTHEDVTRKKRFKMTRRAAIGTLAGAAAGAGTVATSFWYLWPRAPKPVMRLNIDVSPAQQFANFT